MGLLAYGLVPAAALASIGLGDANRGSRSWQWPRQAITRGPLRRPPEAAGLFVSERRGRSARWQHRVGGASGYAGCVVKKVLLASPRGYCAGVERAVDTVEKALELYGPPVYVRKQIVHNLHVVRELEARGAIFVEDEEEVPVGKTVVFSAHGVAPSVHENSEARNLRTIDATCPLVTKVHTQAKRYAAQGYTVILIGHAGHEEVVGTMGEAPD